MTEQPQQYKTTNIRLPLATWKQAKNILIDQGGKETLNALIVRLLNDYAAQNKPKKKSKKLS